MNDDIFKAKLQVLADMQHSFYVDFMPLVQQIKKDIATLKIDKKDILTMKIYQKPIVF